MINFKDPKDQTPSALAVLGLLLIAAAVVVSLFFTRAIDATAFAKKAKSDEASLKLRSMAAQSDNFVYENAISKYQWTEPEDVVTPSALTIISKRAKESRLNLISFRPLKSIENSSMIQLPMQFTVDGSFADVAAMLESLERSDSKLAVQQIQFASQEGETDKVSANINMLAYLAKPVKAKSKSVDSKNSPSSSTNTKAGTSPASVAAP
jgi:Tfp pilus assembly protein PilO